ncbi:macro domain-containing protein [Ruminococcus albus]|nr:macro domain-containing protein [Ruminococcus albus]
MIILKGDLLETPFEIIAHQVNCQGKMASGVAKQIRKKFPWAYSDYMSALEQHGADFMFGKSQIINQNGHTIFNIFGQYNYGYDGKQYTSYEDLESGFVEAINNYRKNIDIDISTQITVTIPYKIGCDRGGGDWSIVKAILESIEKLFNVVFVAYKLEQ